MSGKSDKTADTRIKLLMIGDSGVGKTCLLIRYANDSFSGSFITTIGIDFKLKTVTVDGKSVKLQIWDTAGQERFRTITTAYFRGAHGILLVYDVTDEKSFKSINNWVQQISQHAEAGINKILLGNKADDESQRVVSYEQGKKLAEEHNMEFFETSAKTSMNVEDAYLCIARQCMSRLSKTEAKSSSEKSSSESSEKDSTSKNSNSGGCC